MIDTLNIKTNFKTKDSTKGVKVKLSISIVEIYNENIIDLLAEDESNLNMYENSNGNLIIPDLKPIKISNFSEAAKLFKLAERLRHSNSTQYNDRSSRSHCIFSFFLKIVDGDHVIRSKLNILDLAGSERLSKSVGVMDETQRRETTSINMSLNSLANVLNAIASKQSHIPYRDSKLTHFLKESLTDSFNILMILHVSPNLRDLGETISTLEFGKRIAKICKYKIGKEKINK
jgi:kinesin family protein C2/C3